MEIRHAEGSRIIVVMEATENGAVGARLLEIALMEGVLSANLVFEQSESLGASGEQP
jgi:periplasmic nitrate reductase NapD